MLRFLAFLHDPQDGEQRRVYREAVAGLTRTGGHWWRLAYEGAGLAIWCADGRDAAPAPGAASDHDGLVLGRLFVSSGNQDVPPETRLIPRSLALAICRSEGKWLGSHCWGSYVAFLRDPECGRHCVVRDPTGALPCFHFDHRGVRIFFSDVAVIRRSALFSFAVNPEFIRANVLMPKLQKTITGLIGVDEVLPGQFWTDDRDRRQRSFIWNPYEIVRRPSVDDVEAAAALVRRATEQTVWTLAAPFRRIVHQLGGLDSSIVHACLATAPSRPQLSLLNFFTSSPRGDERHYAREMAGRHGAPLIELPLDHRGLDIEAMAAACDQVSPLSHFECTDLAADTYARADVRQADARFYGVGGDNVFLQAADLFPVLDYVNRNGIDSGLLKVAAGVMRDARWSAWHVATAALRERLSPEPVFDYVYRHAFPGVGGTGFHPALREEGPRTDLLHPLLLPPEGTPKGKCFQVLLSCFCPVEYYDQFFRQDQVERVHVFLSQPIVEACLQIPSWILSLNGIERGLARKAFADQLPDKVLRRLTKGTPEEIYDAFIRANRRALREFLIDGMLVKLGILCPSSLENMLSDNDLEINASSKSLIDFFSWESWARNWSPALAGDNKGVGFSSRREPALLII